ncbi:glycosyltransferase [Lewinella sp. W8]|uniref:glycosyltransferase n=1 Tax=Lewinella sp. W8 TaxID=2528208 RepID=UPI001068AA74|nr:glycosyltransferase [Lewinella sp. W8]MTB49628.1 glycosyltransferase [Lewinella sp. W8]
MRIAVIAPLRFPIREPFRGGLEMFTDLLVRALMERGHEVLLLAHPDSSPDLPLVPVPFPERAGFGGTLRAHARMLRILAKLDVDVIHDNSIHFLPPLWSRKTGRPMVTTLHTPPYRASRLTGWMTRGRHPHRFVSISDHLGRQWAPYVGAYTVVHNGIDLQSWPAELSAPARPLAVCYGRITPEKGIHHAIRAAKVAGFPLSIAGAVADRDYFEQLIAPEVGEDVRYLGHLNRAQLGELLAGASVGVFPAVWDEPFGLVLVEMLACGTPVAAFNSGATPEILTSEVGVVVEKGDAEALASAIGEAAGKDRADCRRRAEQFSIQKMVEAYEAVYRSVLAVNDVVDQGL